MLHLTWRTNELYKRSHDSNQEQPNISILPLTATNVQALSSHQPAPRAVPRLVSRCLLAATGLKPCSASSLLFYEDGSETQLLPDRRCNTATDGQCIMKEKNSAQSSSFAIYLNTNSTEMLICPQQKHFTIMYFEILCRWDFRGLVSSDKFKCVFH